MKKEYVRFRMFQKQLGKYIKRCFLSAFLLLISAGGMKAGAEGASFDYIVPDADVRFLTEQEISWMSLQTVCYARNEIYARRGWIFRSKELSEYFGNQGWYYGRMTPEQFSADILNRYETANVQLLQKRENQLSPSGYVLDVPGYSFDAVYYDLYGEPDAGLVDCGYVIPESDTRYLTEQDLRGCTQQELCYARNEIYARHGRLFQSPELSGYFNSKAWYYGYIDPDDFSTDVFNAYEKANVSLIDDFETRICGKYVLDQPGYRYTGVRSLADGIAQDYAESYIFPDSASRYLTDSEAAVLSARTLCYAKNEIYARHGRLFDSKELRDYFNSRSWYYGWVEPYEFSDMVFNVYEQANIKLLEEYEYEYAPGGYKLYN